jgi:hypothetical protein
VEAFSYERCTPVAHVLVLRCRFAHGLGKQGCPSRDSLKSNRGEYLWSVLGRSIYSTNLYQALF